MVECRRFVFGIFMIYVIVSVSEISLLPVTWLPRWILEFRHEVASAMTAEHFRK